MSLHNAWARIAKMGAENHQAWKDTEANQALNPLPAPLIIKWPSGTWQSYHTLTLGDWRRAAGLAASGQGEG